MSKIIIHIDGVQGSGKSYICNKLKKIYCVDTDDIQNKAITIIEKSQNTNNKLPRTLKSLIKIKNKLVNDIINNNNFIVFVGMTANIQNPTYKFFIKITDFTGVYKRLLLRELNKIIKNKNQIIKHINEETNPNEIDIMRISNLSVMFPVFYNDFINDYKYRIKKAKEDGYIIKTQDEIINEINKFYR